MSNEQEFKHIFEPIRIGNVECRNRILMAAHSYGYADEEGLPTDNLVAYLAERAKGGIGLVIMGGTAVSPEGALPLGHITCSLSDRIIPWYQKISDEVHQYGALVFDQLMHAGGLLRAREGIRIVAPSAIPHERTRGLPVELDEDEIVRVQSDFVEAAKRAKLGGLDGVEVKCDQGFLIQQFLSQYYNRRTDKYGGTYENRMRFLLEILESIRTKVGYNFVVGVRITGDAIFPGDLTIEDAKKISYDLESTGLIDYIHVNGATNSSFIGYLTSHGDSSIQSANFASLAKHVKKRVKLPVMMTSMVTHPAEAERLVASRYADMVAMTRAHIADPEIVNKVKVGKVEDIRPCVLCNQGCVGNHYTGGPVRCIHNPATGRERELGIGTINKDSNPKVIAIVGGGIAGMEVARIAAMRGHEVHLFEKEKVLGGQILLASKLPYRQGLLDIVHYLEKQNKKLGVHVHPKTEVNIEYLLNISNEIDAVVVATGSEPYIPPIYTNIDKSNSLTVRDLLEEKRELGNYIMVIDLDWRQNPLGIAEWLYQRGRKVSVVTNTFSAGDLLDIVSLTSYYSRIHKGVQFFTLRELVAYKDKVVTLRHVLNNELEEISPIDQVIFVTGAIPINKLYYDAKNKLKNVRRVGDCSNPLGIPEALLNANRVARLL